MLQLDSSFDRTSVLESESGTMLSTHEGIFTVVCHSVGLLV